MCRPGLGSTKVQRHTGGGASQLRQAHAADAGSGGRRDDGLMDAKERTLWSSGIGLVVLGVAVAVVVILVVRFTDVGREPWGYIGLTVGILSAVAGLGLAFIRAREVSE
jgi:hypothetical protein